jgi:MFS superfamily sulfate permease-like transporter
VSAACRRFHYVPHHHLRPHLIFPPTTVLTRLADIPRLAYPAATIAVLAAIESLLCARVADTMVGEKHDPNTELIAQVGRDRALGWCTA